MCMLNWQFHSTVKYFHTHVQYMLISSSSSIIMVALLHMLQVVACACELVYL